jgi:hypothetical protein
MFSGSTGAFGQKLYPVSGPATTVTPPSVIAVKFGFGIRSGKISLVLANGESFQGSWKSVTASAINPKSPGTPTSYPPQPNLSFAWDAVYGTGDFAAHRLGGILAQAILTGSQGTVLQVEFRNPWGVTVDNRGNIYKMVWK